MSQCTILDKWLFAIKTKQLVKPPPPIVLLCVASIYLAILGISANWNETKKSVKFVRWNSATQCACVWAHPRDGVICRMATESRFMSMLLSIRDISTEIISHMDSLPPASWQHYVGPMKSRFLVTQINVFVCRTFTHCVNVAKAKVPFDEMKMNFAYTNLWQTLEK